MAFLSVNKSETVLNIIILRFFITKTPEKGLTMNERIPPSPIHHGEKGEITETTSIEMTENSSDTGENRPKLHFRAGDVPQWKQSMLLGFQVSFVQNYICLIFDY